MWVLIDRQSARTLIISSGFILRPYSWVSSRTWAPSIVRNPCIRPSLRFPLETQNANEGYDGTGSNKHSGRMPPTAAEDKPLELPDAGEVTVIVATLAGEIAAPMG